MTWFCTNVLYYFLNVSKLQNKHRLRLFVFVPYKRKRKYSLIKNIRFSICHFYTDCVCRINDFHYQTSSNSHDPNWQKETSYGLVCFCFGLYSLFAFILSRRHWQVGQEKHLQIHAITFQLEFGIKEKITIKNYWFKCIFQSIKLSL